MLQGTLWNHFLDTKFGIQTEKYHKLQRFLWEYVLPDLTWTEFDENIHYQFHKIEDEFSVRTRVRYYKVRPEKLFSAKNRTKH